MNFIENFSFYESVTRAKYNSQIVKTILIISPKIKTILIIEFEKYDI